MVSAALAAALATSAFGVQLGDNRAAVVTELGAPTGEVAAGVTTILFYPRGEIRLREGKVSAIQLISEDELTAQQQAEAELKERLKIETAEREARLAAEGRALYAAKKKDPAFASLPVADQLGFWRAFAVRFPMIPIGEEIETLRARYDHEERLRDLERANQQQMAALEARVREAEERAARAEREARQSRYSGYDAWWWHRRPHRPSPRDDKPDRPRTDNERESIDEARARAMGDYEDARAEAYRRTSP